MRNNLSGSDSKRILLLLTLVLCLVPGVLPAQEFRATVTGHVTDPSGASVPGAVVQARNLATNEVATATTDAEGSYTIPFLKPGLYQGVQRQVHDRDRRRSATASRNQARPRQRATGAQAVGAEPTSQSWGRR